MYEKRINGFGAVDQLRGRVFRMNTTAEKSMQPLKLLETHPRRRLRIYPDNPPVHRSKMLKKWPENHPKVVLKYLSRCSPDINPREEWWNHERAKLLNNRYFPTNRKLGGAVRHFVGNTPPGTVESVCITSAIEQLLK